MKPDLKAKFVYHFLWKPFKKWNLARDLLRNSRWQPSDFTQKTIQGKAPRQGKVLCLFAHFDPEGLIRPFDVHHLEALKNDLQCDIAFCSTNIDLENPTNIEILNRLTFLTVARKNKGHDFGSWKTLLDKLGAELNSYDYLVLTNNSVLGPLFALSSPQKSLRPTDNAIVGMTESNEREHHLQSYFLMIPRAVFMTEAFRRFWKNLRFLDVKKNIVYAYEMGLSRALQKVGIEIRALYPTASVVAGNPTHKIWLELVRDRKCPYLKRDILKRTSPQELKELRQWVSQNTSYDSQWI